MDVLLKLPYCNLNCSYCLSPYPVVTKRISFSQNRLESIISDLEKICTAIENIGSRPHIVFHGGEFTLLSPHNLKFIINKLFDEIGIEDISLQTNGVLINDDIAKILSMHDISVGVSLDGPKDLHDYFRKYPDGRGTFEDVIKGVKTLKKYDVNVAGIAVITKRSLGREKDIYEIYEKLEISLQISFLMPIGRGSLLRNLCLSNNEAISFVKRILNIWREHNFSIKIYPVLSIIAKIFGGKSFCSYSPYGCYSILSYDIVERKLGPCPELSVFRPRLLNVSEAKYEDIERSIQEYFQIRHIIEQYKMRCSNCPLYKFCGGGCLREQYGHFGREYLRKSYVYCKFRREIIPYIIKFITENLKKEVIKV